MIGRGGPWLRLADGRRLGWCEYGDPRGRPVLYFHGLPGSRLEAALAHQSAARAGVRLITLDRPGIGESDPHPGRTLLDWPADVEALCSHLQIERCSAIGVSGGGPYALACAYRIGTRLRRVAVISGVGPLGPTELADMLGVNRIVIGLARRRARLLRPLLSVASLARLVPAVALGVLAARLPEPDRSVLRRASVRQALEPSFVAGLLQGGRSLETEVAILARPWGFALTEIEVPVVLWHGGRDLVVPQASGRAVEAGLAPTAPVTATYLSDEGHFSLVIDHTDAIFASLSGLDQ